MSCTDITLPACRLLRISVKLLIYVPPKLLLRLALYTHTHMHATHTRMYVRACAHTHTHIRICCDRDLLTSYNVTIQTIANGSVLPYTAKHLRGKIFAVLVVFYSTVNVLQQIAN